jgi:hypothetical protein
MAVSFKVPASPKRSIFNIDEFLGADLTNTGSNIDEVRSPNAENMIRYVPGKVRKRMGYENYVQFSTPTNVNRALGTSEKEQRFELNKWVIDEPVEFTTLYNLTQTFPAGTIFYIEFDYKADYYFWPSVIEEWLPPSREWTHYSGSASSSIARDTFKAVGGTLGTDVQVLYIKSFSIMTAKDANYKYKKAPTYYVERETRIELVLRGKNSPYQHF